MRSLPKGLVILTSDFPPSFGGIQRTAERLASVAHELGVRVAVVAAASSGDAAFDRALPYPVLRYHATSLAGSLQPMAKLTRRAVRMVRADRLVATIWSPPGLAAVLLRLTGLRIPVTVIAHGTDIANQNGLLRRTLLRAVLQGTDVVACSRFTAGLVAERGIPSVRVANLGSSPVRSAGAERAEVPTVLMAGRLVRRKGYDKVIEAVAQLALRFPTLQLIVVGDGPDRARLESLVRELDIDAIVHFQGRASDEELAAWYERAWCFAMPNRTEGTDVEGFGLVFLEAALHGTPSIGGRDSGAEDAIADGVSGYIVDGRDTAAVRIALDRLLSDRDLVERLGRAAKERVERDFTWERYTTDVLTGG
jgi:glycosyltransferase involved in cell wall biosynthesis